MSEESVYGEKANAEYEDKNGNFWLIEAEGEGDIEIITGEDLPTPADPRRPRYNAVIRSGEKIIRVSCYAESLTTEELDALRGQAEELRFAAESKSAIPEEEGSRPDADGEEIRVAWSLTELTIDGPIRTRLEIDPDIAANKTHRYGFNLGNSDAVASLRVTTSLGSVSGSLRSGDFSVSSFNAGQNFPLSAISLASAQWQLRITGEQEASYIVTGDFEIF